MLEEEGADLPEGAESAGTEGRRARMAGGHGGQEGTPPLVEALKSWAYVTFTYTSV